MKIAVKREEDLILVEIFDEKGEREHLAEFIDQAEGGYLVTKESRDLFS